MPDATLDDAVIEPGQYDITAEEYHADPVPGGSLSSTGARLLLATCPAKYRWEQDHGRAATRAMEMGTAAHLAVLGVGPDLVRIDAENYRTKTARKKRDDARADGAVPLLADEYDRALAMADVLRRHPRASELFAPGGEAEQTFIWQDPDTGIWCRCRVDWLSDPDADRLRIVDYKTTASANPADLEAAIWRYAYHQQDPFYRDGVRAVLGREAEFTFVFQEKEPPYLVTVVQLPMDAVELGEARNARARLIFAECQSTGIWPDYGHDTHFISLPPWAADRDAKEYL
ncbi:PD-(D/E)XK nuclease-like domain-containing protein [Streptomyces sp. 4N509B]|uniref:PD-(D/E)XK nuclease-like domain-containing protein n=1 Tax=Streptomyces sp. 4N509B TaxID=3457413 RepID=UPI003FD12ABF